MGSDVARLAFEVDSTAAKTGSDQVTRALDDIRKKSIETTGAFTTMQGTLDKTAERALAFARFAGLALGVREVVAYADSWKLVEGQLRGVTTSTAQLASTESALFQQANETRQSYEATAELYARISRATKDLGIDQGALLNVTEAVSRAVLLSNVPTQQARAGLIQLGQAFAFGKLQGQDLKAILEDVPVLGQSIARGLGVSTAELRRLGTEGKVSAEDMVRSLTKVLPSLEAQSAAIPRTVGQSFTLLENHFEKWLGESDKAVGATALLSSGVSGLANNINLLADATVVLASAMGVRWIERYVAGQVASVQASNAQRAATLASAEAQVLENEALVTGAQARLTAATRERELAEAALLNRDSQLLVTTATGERTAAEVALAAVEGRVLVATEAETAAALQLAETSAAVNGGVKVLATGVAGLTPNLMTLGGAMSAANVIMMGTVAATAAGVWIVNKYAAATNAEVNAAVKRNEARAQENLKYFADNERKKSLAAETEKAVAEATAAAHLQLDKQIALNSAFGSSSLEIAKLTNHYDALLERHAHLKDHTPEQIAALDAITGSMERQKNEAATLAYNRQVLEKWTASNGTQIGINTDNRQRVVSAQQELDLIGKTGAALAHQREAYAELNAIVAVKTQYEQQLIGLSLEGDDVLRAAEEKRAAENRDAAIRAIEGERALHDLAIDTNVALEHRATLLADRTANQEAIRDAQQQLALAQSSGVAQALLRDQQEASNALEAARLQFVTETAGKSWEEVVFARQRYEATVKTIGVVKDLHDQTARLGSGLSEPMVNALRSIQGDASTFFQDLVTNGLQSFDSLWGSFKSLAIKTFGELAAMKLVQSILSPSAQIAAGISPGASAPGSAAFAAGGLPGWGLAIGGLALAGVTLLSAGNAQAEAAREFTLAAQSFHAAALGQTQLEAQIASIVKQRDDLAKQAAGAGQLSPQEYFGQTGRFVPLNTDAEKQIQRMMDDFWSGVIHDLNALNGPLGAMNNALADAEAKYLENRKNADALNASLEERQRIDILYNKTVQDIIAGEAERTRQIDEDLSVRILSAQGRTAEADAMRQEIQFRRELADAEKNQWSDSEKAELAYAESLDREAAAQQAAQDAADKAAAAVERLTKSTEDMTARYLRLLGQSDAADTAGLLASQRQARSDLAAADGTPSEVASLFIIQSFERAQQQVQQEAAAQTAALTTQTGILRDTLDVAQKALEVDRRAADSLSEYAASLSLSDLSPLSPIDRLHAAQSQRDAIYQAAIGGDASAAEKFGSADQAFLKEEQSYSASGAAFQAAFADSQAKSNALAAMYGGRATADEQIVALLTSQRDTLQAQLDEIQKGNTIAQQTQDRVVAQLQAEGDSATGPADAVLAALSGIRDTVDLSGRTIIDAQIAGVQDARTQVALATQAEIDAIQSGASLQIVAQDEQVRQLELGRLSHDAASAEQIAALAAIQGWTSDSVQELIRQQQQYDGGVQRQVDATHGISDDFTSAMARYALTNAAVTRVFDFLGPVLGTFTPAEVPTWTAANTAFDLSPVTNAVGDVESAIVGSVQVNYAGLTDLAAILRDIRADIRGLTAAIEDHGPPASVVIEQ